MWWVLSAIQPVLAADRVFQSQARGPSVGAQGTPPPPPPAVVQDTLRTDEDYIFRGMICYYGMHYIAIFWCWAQMQWTLFDDTTVQQKKDWSSVVNLILSGGYVPTLLFHERAVAGDSAARIQSFQELKRQIDE